MDVLANAIKRQNSSNKYPSPVLYEPRQPIITLTTILHTDFSFCYQKYENSTCMYVVITSKGTAKMKTQFLQSRHLLLVCY